MRGRPSSLTSRGWIDGWSPIRTMEDAHEQAGWNGGDRDRRRPRDRPRACARARARRGRVVVNDRGGSLSGDGADDTPANEVVAEIEALGGEAVANGADVSDFGAAEKM